MISDKEFICDPSRWPQWPFLPMKRTLKDSSWPECGFLFEGKWIIYLYNIFKLSTLSSEEAKKALMECTKYEYSDVDALLADGWIID
jgi:hypothetical protein